MPFLFVWEEIEMNDLTNLKGNGFEWTSKDIEEWTGKEHKNIMRDIRDELDKLIEGGMEVFGKLNFEQGTFTNERNQSFPMYKLTKLGIQQLCMRYDAIIRAKVNMKLEEISKPICVEDMIIQSAQNLKALRLEQERQQKLLVDTTNRVEVLEAKQINSPYEFFSIVGYCNLKGIKCELAKAIRWGKEASKLSKELGVKMGTTPDPRFGQVNTYHVDILKQIML